MKPNTTMLQLSEIAARIKEMREIMGWTVTEMAEKTDVTEQTYLTSTFRLASYINAHWPLMWR